MSESAEPVSQSVSIGVYAANRKHGMTLDELAAFVQHAMRLGVPGDAIVRIENTWRSSIKRATAGGTK